MKLVADTHIHSLACSHAYSTIMENIEEARKKGLAYMAMTEHGPNMPDAPHIWHVQCQWDVPSVWNGVNILHGVEADVLEGGRLDVSDKILASLEWVIASMHRQCLDLSNRENHTNIWLEIAKNPHVDVIGHCAKSGYDFDEEKVLRAFKEYGKLVEINNSCFVEDYGCVDRYMEIIRCCKRLEVPVIVNTDSHFAGNIGVFDGALQALQEVDFPEKLIVNADLGRFEEIVKEKRAGVCR